MDFGFLKWLWAIRPHLTLWSCFDYPVELRVFEYHWNSWILGAVILTLSWLFTDTCPRLTFTIKSELSAQCYTGDNFFKTNNDARSVLFTVMRTADICKQRWNSKIHWSCQRILPSNDEDYFGLETVFSAANSYSRIVSACSNIDGVYW